MFRPIHSIALVVAALVLPVSLAFSQQSNGRIVGRVVDAASGNPVPGAQVTLEGTAIAAIADWTGRFALERVPSGSQVISVRMIGYQHKSVRDVVVEPNQTRGLDVTIAAAAIEVAAIEVTAEMERGSVAHALNEQRNATGIVSAVTAEQIQKSPDSDAGQAVQRVSGVTVQDGRYVFVRGLGERYTTTSLNSARIPSPEPERKVVPLDLFPAGVLEGITTSKTFTPDQPGDFSGAQVNLRTRAFDLGRVLRFSASGSGNDAELGAGLPRAPRVGREWLGFGGAARRLPARLAAAGDLSSVSQNQFATLIGSMRNVWSALPATGIAGRSFSGSVGGEDPVFGQRIAYLASVSYAAADEVRRGERRAVAIASSTPGEALPQNAARGTSGSATVLWGGILNVNSRIGQRARLAINNTYTRSAENQATRLAGHNEEFARDLDVTRLTFTERSVASSQLNGQYFVAGRHLLDWTVTASRVSRNEPDRSDLVYEASIDTITGAVQALRWWGAPRSASRTFSALHESGLQGGANYQLNLGAPGSATYVKAGVDYRHTERDADTRLYDIVNFDLSDTERAGRPDQVLAQLSRLYLSADANAGRYTATDELTSGYIQVSIPLSSRALLIGGARVERSHLDVQTFRPSGTPAPAAQLRNTDLLPSLALTLRLTPDHNLRLSASQTLSRPEYRELSGVQYRDLVFGLNVQGNPGLRRALIQNFDARWEWYPSPAEVISVAAFGKHFDDPIERIIVGTTGANTISFVNAAGATNYGVELEARKQLGDVTLFANTTLMRSRIRPGNDSIASLSSQNRAMVGQAEYVVNGGVSYNAPSGFGATLLYNVVGPRITEAGTIPLPDAYERERHVVDLALRAPLALNTTFKLDAKNLLDAPVHTVQGGVTRLWYRTGRTLSVGLTWEP
ncbi:MAG: TonB-dependent receptor domain-containing protein [Gemmatimonadales bacterium]